MAIEIATAEDFMNINNDLFADYIQVADIDLAGYDFEPLGDLSVIGLPFLGTYDGQGYTIRNITINTEKSQAGIFALKYGGFLRNMIIENVNITAKHGSGVGALVGYTDALIENILLRNITITGNYDIGGLAGGISGTVKKVAIVGVNLTGQGLVGGLVGENSGTI